MRSPVAGQVITWDLYNRLNQRPVERGQLLLQIADPENEWQLELKVPDDRIGHVIRAQNALYGTLRERLRAALRDDLRRKLGEKAAVPQAGGPSAESAGLAPAEGPGLGAAPAAPPLEPAPEKPVAAEAEAGLDQEVETALAAVPDEQLRERIRELTGEDMEDRLKVEFSVFGDPGSKHYGWIREVGRYAEVRDEEGNTVLVKVDIDKADLKPEHRRHGTTVTAKVACGRRALGYVLFHGAIAWFQKLWFRLF